MEDNEIKQIINRTRQKISMHRLNEKIKAFNKVELPLLVIKYIEDPIKVSRKDLRFYLELIDCWYPIYKNADNITKAQFISEVFKCICTKEDLDNLKSFKEITKKQVIIMKNENVKTISRLRWRSRDRISNNIIHFQK